MKLKEFVIVERKDVEVTIIEDLISTPNADFPLIVDADIQSVPEIPDLAIRLFGLRFVAPIDKTTSVTLAAPVAATLVMMTLLTLSDATSQLNAFERLVET